MAAVAAQRHALEGSRSLSLLLQKRSDAEEPDLPDIDAQDKENPLAVCEARRAHSRGRPAMASAAA